MCSLISETDNQQKEKEAGEHKRKYKFSERELEVLIEEVTKDHDKLFGQNSLHLPESQKRQIWLVIKERINTIGVTQRSIEELKKCGYDLRKRAKERLDDRIKQAKQNGGGISTAPVPTALDLLVESTLQPESVSAIGDADSSARAGNRQGKSRHDVAHHLTLVASTSLIGKQLVCNAVNTCRKTRPVLFRRAKYCFGLINHKFRCETEAGHFWSEVEVEGKRKLARQSTGSRKTEMDTLLLAMILALGLHYSTVRSQDPTLDTDNADVQDYICLKHNEVRQNVNPPASDMQKIVWSKEIAANAKKVAAKCLFKHSSDDERKLGTIVCGENLAQASGGSLSWERVMQMWFDEAKDFEYGVGATKPGAVTGHYTQTVWGSTTLAGCAWEKCLNFDLYVCQYAPPGNYQDMIKTPYTAGIQCSKCPDNCEKGLCTKP
ncbi:uncharacterized protein LOC144762942 [Lissotriton helveticus]